MIQAVSFKKLDKEKYSSIILKEMFTKDSFIGTMRFTLFISMSGFRGCNLNRSK